jgi:hypothetical protein
MTTRAPKIREANEGEDDDADGDEEGGGRGTRPMHGDQTRG